MPDIPEWVWTLIAGFLGAGTGTGAIGTLLYRGLKDRLIGDFKEIFARRSELNAWGDRVNALETVAIQGRNQADNNQDAIIRLQGEAQHRWEPMRETLERISDRLDKLDENQGDLEKMMTQTATILDQVQNRLDRHSERYRRNDPTGG